MKTKLQILKETADYYSADPSRRGYIEGSCEYLTSDNKRCALGRVSKLTGTKLVDLWGTVEDIIGCEYSDKQFFKPEYRGHSVKFWQDLQFFHDVSSNWTKTGLSAKGRRKLESLKKKYK